ncbi:hypothetical protein AB434P3_00002 [Agathobaculum phage AB434P3]|jgi:hypothetical protein|nr:hypothetical protein AB434P3_00002 [Agathobaculum phage AB434P3]
MKVLKVLDKAIKILDSKNNKKSIIKKLENEVKYLEDIRNNLDGNAKSDLDGAISRIKEAINELRW